MSYYHEPDGQLTLLELGCPENAATQPRRKAPAKSVSELVAIPYLYLDLSPGHVDLFGNHYWELRSPYREGKPPLNTGPAPREPIHRSLSEILESDPDAGYYLSGRACRGILRRAKERGKELPHQLKAALTAQAGVVRQVKKLEFTTGELAVAFAANQRDEVRDLLEWRKLMSAVSYLVAFLVGGALAERGLPRPGIALACCSGLAVAVEAAAALAGNTDLLVALSFKSTSALSFALAVCSVAVAAARADDRMSPRLSALLRRLASSILGFYVAQALLSPLWRSFGWDLCLAALDHGEAALLATGVVWSLVLLAALLALDQLVRIPLLRAARIR